MNQESSNATHMNADTNNNMTTTTHATTNSTKQPCAAELGFRMPAEWEQHERCWMMWPSRKEMWSDINNTKKHYADVANAIGRFEPVSMLINAEDMDAARDLLADNVTLVEAKIDDSWARDAGPNFLLNDKGEVAGSTWRFNAWGEKYSPFNNDDQVGHQVLTHCNAHNFVSELVAEGGGITVDGEGTVITTESCFLHTNRNPGWSKKEVEDELCRTLGAKKVIWLPGNVDETETDGHVDGIAQFVRPGVVLMETSFDINHPWYEILQANRKVLEGQTDAKGRPIEIVLIEDGNGCEMLNERFCTSYINAYLANGAVIMPKYGIATDERARKVYQRLFPEREIVQVDIRHIAVGGGGIHCITQQQPSAQSAFKSQAGQ